MDDVLELKPILAGLRSIAILNRIMLNGMNNNKIINNGKGKHENNAYFQK